ncbi:hypothetical protein ONZ45_g9503 [Pleurotus djamor]|nr:hypothetical protein ONZ45_g9503 [Pleurotus djamor]
MVLTPIPPPQRPTVLPAYIPQTHHTNAPPQILPADHDIMLAMLSQNLMQFPLVEATLLEAVVPASVEAQ